MKRGTGLAAAFLLVAIPAFSNVPEPIDYVASFPPGEWQLSRQIWKPAAPCTRDLCEAGVFVPPLMVRLRRYSDSLKITAQIQGCFSITEWFSKPADYSEMGIEDRVRIAEQKIKSLSESIAAYCQANLTSPLPPTDLHLLFATPP